MQPGHAHVPAVLTCIDAFALTIALVEHGSDA